MKEAIRPHSLCQVGCMIYFECIVVFLNAYSDGSQILPGLPENYSFEIVPSDVARKIAEITKEKIQLQNKRAVIFAKAQEG